MQTENKDYLLSKIHFEKTYDHVSGISWVMSWKRKDFKVNGATGWMEANFSLTGGEEWCLGIPEDIGKVTYFLVLIRFGYRYFE